MLPGDSEAGFHIRLAAENVAAVWSSFRRRGARRLVVARIVESADEIAVVAAAVPDCVLTVCRLVAEPDTLQRRLHHREAGTSVEFLTSVTTRLASTIGQLELPGFTLQNADGMSIADLALDVINRIGWPVALAPSD